MEEGCERGRVSEKQSENRAKFEVTQCEDLACHCWLGGQKGAPRQRVWVASWSWKGQLKGFYPRAPGGMKTCQDLAFSLEKLLSDF